MLSAARPDHQHGSFGKRGTRGAAPTRVEFGVIGLTQVMAQELASHGITVNASARSVDTSRVNRPHGASACWPSATVRAVSPAATGRIARPTTSAPGAVLRSEQWITSRSGVDVDGGP